MPKLIDMKGSARLVLVGGAIGTGNEDVAHNILEILKQHSCRCCALSLEECAKVVGGLGNETPREKYWELFKGKENDPWLSRAISKAYEAEEGQIVVVSGLKRKCDAEYFHSTFPNAYFISLIAGQETLVERIVAENMPRDFPAGTNDADKPGIARKLIAGEEAAYSVMQMLGYAAAQIPRENTYLIENEKELSKAELEKMIHKALIHFKIV